MLPLGARSSMLVAAVGLSLALTACSYRSEPDRRDIPSVAAPAPTAPVRTPKPATPPPAPRPTSCGVLSVAAVSRIVGEPVEVVDRERGCEFRPLSTARYRVYAEARTEAAYAAFDRRRRLVEDLTGILAGDIGELGEGFILSGPARRGGVLGEGVLKVGGAVVFVVVRDRQRPEIEVSAIVRELLVEVERQQG